MPMRGSHHANAYTLSRYTNTLNHANAYTNDADTTSPVTSRPTHGFSRHITGTGVGHLTLLARTRRNATPLSMRRHATVLWRRTYWPRRRGVKAGGLAAFFLASFFLA